MNRSARRVFGMGLVLSMSMPVLAGIPEVLDRVPTNAGLIIAIDNLSGFHARAEGLISMLSLDSVGPGNVLGMTKAWLDTPGLNATGGLVIAFLTDAQGHLELEGEAPQAAMFIPVSDFNAFAGAFEGKDEGGVIVGSMDGDTIYLKDIGGGYALASPNRDLASSMNPVAGNMASHAKRLGATGIRVASSSAMFAAVDVQVVAPMITEAGAGFREQMEMVSSMMGDQAQGMGAMGQLIETFAQDLARDGQTGLVGVSLADDGVSLDLAATFKDGSEMAQAMSVPGNAIELLSHVPDMPYLLAGAIDMSSPAVRNMFKAMGTISASMTPGQPNMMELFNLGKMIDGQRGMAMVMGNPPSMIMGGMFSKTVQYIACDDPKASIATVTEMMKTMNGMASGPMRFETEFKPGLTTVEGTSIDGWGMKMALDPADPSADQMQMGMMMIFGPQMGLSGYYAQVPGGLITTYARESGLAAKAIQAAGAGGGLGTSADVRAAAARLPKRCVVAAFVGLDSLMQQASGLMAMGGQSFGVDVPESMGALALGIAMSDGSTHARVFVPQSLLSFVGQVIEAQSGAADDDVARPPSRRPQS